MKWILISYLYFLMKFIDMVNAFTAAYRVCGIITKYYSDKEEYLLALGADSEVIEIPEMTSHSKCLEVRIIYFLWVVVVFASVVVRINSTIVMYNGYKFLNKRQK